VITFDTGALIALERNKQRVVQIFQSIVRRGDDITVPAVVITEWWRGRTDLREDILDSVVVEPLSPRIAKVAGEALAGIRGATAIDAIVMASAASRGDVVLTADVHDLEKLRSFFPSVRVLGV
jgi:predicted nucleic acid-binding protein